LADDNRKAKARRAQSLKAEICSPHPSGIFAMAEYRAYVVGNDGHVVSYEPSFAKVMRMLRYGQSSLSMGTTLSFGAATAW
jgi:hypothetical protein